LWETYNYSLNKFYLPDFDEDARKNCLVLEKANSTEEIYWDSVRCVEKWSFICQKRLNYEAGCLNKDNKREFEGKINISIDNEPCLMWNDPEILRRRFLLKNQRSMRHNFCRNPENDFLPWCFTGVDKFNYCDVPDCPEENICDRKEEFRCGNGSKYANVSKFSNVKGNTN